MTHIKVGENQQDKTMGNYELYLEEEFGRTDDVVACQDCGSDLCYGCRRQRAADDCDYWPEYHETKNPFRDGNMQGVGQ